MRGARHRRLVVEAARRVDRPADRDGRARSAGQACQGTREGVARTRERAARRAAHGQVRVRVRHVQAGGGVRSVIRYGDRELYALSRHERSRSVEGLRQFKVCVLKCVRICTDYVRVCPIDGQTICQVRICYTCTGQSSCIV